MSGSVSERRGTLAGAAVLMLLPLFLWAAIFADRRFRGWWIGIATLLLLVAVRDWSRRKRRPPLNS